MQILILTKGDEEMSCATAIYLSPVNCRQLDGSQICVHTPSSVASSHIVPALSGLLNILGSEVSDRFSFSSITIDAGSYTCFGFVLDDGRAISFVRPVQVSLLKQDGYFIAEIEQAGIIIAEVDLLGAKRAIKDYLSCHYSIYALADDSELTSEAIEIKKWFLNNTIISDSES